jgi:hypothetical protein
VQAVSETQCSFRLLYSMIQTPNPVSIYMKLEQVNIEWGKGGRGRQKDREQWISGERDGAREGFGKGVGCKFDC